jgi:ribosome recycling factor
MAYDFSALKQEIMETEARLGRELAGIRTGRASATLLDAVRVEAYGAQMPIQQVGGVTMEDPRTIRIVPYDRSQVRALEKAIVDADLGVSVSSDDAGVRVAFPALTAERREGLIKMARSRLEDARIALRGARDEVWSDIQKATREGDIPEDDKFRLKDEMQKIIDDANKRLEEATERKESEIAL